MASKNFSYDDLLNHFPVSRETYRRLQKYVELLTKWQKTINLIGNNTLDDIWNRHISDSLQLVSHVGTGDRIVDLGTGAGLPGMVMAIAGLNVTLIESDVRKTAFLKEAARLTECDVEIVTARVEDTDISSFNSVVARAFAPLPDLLELISGTLNNSHKLMLLKGKSYISELAAARTGWSFDYDAIPSLIQNDGVLLSMRNLKRTGVL